jgi:FtsH-binding integral membrane protein
VGGDSLDEAQLIKAIYNFVAIPLIIIIGLYLVASAITPFLNLNNQAFRIIFTLAGGVPTLIFFFKKKMRKLQKKSGCVIQSVL